MSPESIAAVMVHVSDVQAGLAWYQRAFPAAVRSRVDGRDFEYLTIDGVRLEIVAADVQVSAGPCGSVVYWHVADFDTALAHFQSSGAKLYRGPLRIENDVSMCQVQDPWGNCIGLRGPSKSQK